MPVTHTRQTTPYLAYHRLNKKKGRMAGQVRIRIRFQNYVSGWFDYLMVSKEEMTELLEGTGWTIKEVIDSEASKYVAIIGKTHELSGE